MKTKHLLLAAFIAGLELTACSKADPVAQIDAELTAPDYEDTVTIHFAMPSYTIEPFTRSTSITQSVSRLDVYITDGTTTSDIHQAQTDADFGSISVTLNRTKTYTLVAVAHKCNGNATIADGIITFPEEKVTQSMVYTTTFSPATTTAINADMQRIVGQFRFEVADAVPDDIYTFEFNFGNSFTRWNYASSIGANSIARTATFSGFTRQNDGTVIFNLFVIPTNLTDTDQMNITVTAKKENGDVVETKAFSDVPIRAGYKTTYHGEFFTTTSVTAAFTVADWNAFDTVNF